MLYRMLPPIRQRAKIYAAPIVLLLCLIMGCGSNDGFPDPYDGYTHHSAEHGYWRQVESTGASAGKTIQELHLHADGFSVTWDPFEFYKDYWGSYSYREDTGAIEFLIEMGNYEPVDFHGLGHLVFDSPDRLRLVGVWLGSPQSSEVAVEAELVFERFHPE